MRDSELDLNADQPSARSAGASSRSRVLWARVVRGVLSVVLACAVSLVVIGLREVKRGEAALARSDAAFHSGDLATAIREARTAVLSSVPGAPHVKSGEERLEAIARGAEAEGNRELARRAWDALRWACVQTDYPGRGVQAARQRAEQALRRLDGEL